jgi:sortase A
MKKKLWKLPFFLGILLILTAGGLCIYNIHADRTAFERSQEVMTKLRDIIPETSATASTAPQPTSEDLFAPYEEPSTAPVEMPAIEVNGCDYCGYITLPALGLELPVTSNWSMDELKSSPCRYSGTAEEHNLIIAAHNYNSHFGKIRSLTQGDEVYFTDINGCKYLYTVISSEVIDGKDIDQMLSGQTEQWDLTLFTCTLDGKSRVTLRLSLSS